MHILHIYIYIYIYTCIHVYIYTLVQHQLSMFLQLGFGSTSGGYCLSETHLLVGAFETALFDHPMMTTGAVATPAAEPFPARAAVPQATVDARFACGPKGQCAFRTRSRTMGRPC